MLNSSSLKLSITHQNHIHKIFLNLWSTNHLYQSPKSADTSLTKFTSFTSSIRQIELSHCLFICFQIITLGLTCILCNRSYRGFAWPSLDPSQGFVVPVILLLSLWHKCQPCSTEPSIGVHMSSSPLIKMVFLPIMDPKLMHSSSTYVQGALSFSWAPRSTSRLATPHVPTTNTPKKINPFIRCQIDTCVPTSTTFRSAPP